MKNTSSSYRCHSRSIALGIAGLFLLTSPFTQAAIIANFTGGNGSTLPDQYVGTAGNGWNTAWSFRNGAGGSSTTTIAVTNTDPINSSGNYLSLGYVRSASATGSNRAGVARQFLTTGSNSVSTASPYTIAFDFRADTLTGFTSVSDQIAFSSETTTNIGSFGGDAPWSLWIRGDNKWIVSDGDGSGGTPTNLDFTSLGLTSVTVGMVYKITVFIDPASNGYDLTINNGTTTYRASDLNGGELLGFRDNAAAASANVLQFRSTADASGDAIVMSLDNIAVVPEPSTMALLLGGVGCLALLKGYRP